MKKIVLSIALLAVFMGLTAQVSPNYATLTLEQHQLNQAAFKLPDGTPLFKASAAGTIPLSEVAPFLAYSLTIHSSGWDEASKMNVFFYDGAEQSEAERVELDPHSERNEEGIFTSRLYFASKNALKFRIHYAGQYEIERVDVHFFSPGETVTPPIPIVANEDFRSACPCPQPAFFDRDGWCPNGDCPTDADPEWTTVTHLIVHHSATSNTSLDWPAVVRSIWNGHVNGNGWDDIGYNWLIDPEGNIYQGRFDNQQGAHFCSKNQGTMGVCMMGTYTSELPTVAALTALEQLLAWKSCDENIDPIGSGWHWISGAELPHISGHRDGCNTACPGDTFYPALNTVRDGVQYLLENECGGFVINAPTNLWADAVPPNYVGLTWVDNADNETGYQVERSADYNNDFELIATLPADANYYEDGDPLDFTVDYFYRVRAVVGDSSSAYSNEAVFTPPVGVSDLLTADQIEVFPNPTTGQISVTVQNKAPQKWGVQVFDVYGKSLIRQSAVNTESTSIDLSPLPSGIYLLKISQDGVVVSRRIVKE